MQALGQRAVGQLVVRAILVRGITLLGTIALARLLTPAEFGAFAVVSVIVSFITIAGDFGTSAALIQRGRDAVVPALGGLAGGLQAIGYLGFAWRNGQLVTAVEQIVQRVAFPAFSRIQHEPERQAAMTRSSIELVTLAVATIQGWIVATAPILVPIVFSDRWTPAVVPLQIVCLGSLASAPTYVLRALVYARGNSQLGLKLSAAGLVVLIVSFLVLATTAGLVGAAVSFAFSAYAGLGLYLWATRATVAFPWVAVARIVVVVGAAAIAGGLVALAWPTLPGLVFSGLVYLGTIAGLGFILDRPLAVQLFGLVPIRR